LIYPLEEHLDGLGIDTLIFCMDAGLRQIPLAALHDGERFLIEKYSLGSIPSFSLTNTSYQAIQETRMLAMGASDFQPKHNLNSLPSVPEELATVTQLWQGKEDFFLNEAFTLENLERQTESQPLGIVHLATHADFKGAGSRNSFIQLWDATLSLEGLRALNWYQKSPQIELLTLSACNTALGDREAELGFGGLATQAGVKSAVASLWYVDDEATLALMSAFYDRLGNPDIPIKAEALRQAQLSMLQGELAHPYYWAGFTTVCSPW
ncbi:MAG: CHAT domain-containing protein, partial [Cyanobacteriota bacterium]|nr:CHAT domain-containing protein [Cyanobacteriota bacterium]